MHRSVVFFAILAACTPPKTGPAATTPKSWLVGDNGAMLSTTGSGDTHARPHLTESTLNGLAAADPYTAWAVGDAGQILFTTDSGAHWLPQISGTSVALYAVSFSNAQHGVAAGEAGTLLETNDAGAHWQRVATGEARAYRAIALSTSSGEGVAVGDGGLVSWTSDGGRTFSPHPSAGTAMLTGVAINEDDVALAVGRGGAAYRIARAEVQPLSWALSSTHDLMAVRFMPDGDHAVAVGAQGTVVLSQLSLGAVSLATVASAEDLYAVAVFGDGLSATYDEGAVGILAAGANGAIVYAATASSSFDVVPSHTSATIRSVDALNSD